MMDVTKVEQNKQKTRGKVSSNSNQSFKFIEKESLSGCSLSFANLPSSLCSFIPKEQESLSHEIDFEIAKHLKKLEKKDPVTKQKSLNHLLEIFKTKDEFSVISTLKFWPKLYNQLSLDEDKKVRELTQQLMGRYSSVCGKEISSIIKNLLPTWIISQSDLHIAAANIAKQSFIDTFPTKIKQEKAYLLCWRSIYSIISVNLSKTPVKVNDDISYTPKEEAYIQDIVVNVRTINTLIPYLKDNEEASNDLVTLLSSKNFWAHFKQNITLIQSVYIQLSAELLTNLFGLVKSSSFLSSNVCECFRMIDNYNSQLISRIWDTIVKCCINFGEDVWKLVSFKNVFLPKLLKLLECGAEGNISQIYSCMLPFFTHLPIAMAGADATGIYDKIIAAMTVGAECTRIVHNEFESICAWKMIYECSVYTILVASNATTSNSLVVTTVLNRVLELTLRLFSEVRFKPVGQTMSDFVSVFIRPIISKTGVPRSQLIHTFLSWVEEQHANVVFCDRLARWVLEFDRSASGASECFHEFRLELLTQLEMSLKGKVTTGQFPQCVVPYFCVLFSLSKSDSVENSQMVSETALTILHQCGHLMKSDSDPVLIDIIGHGIAFLVGVLDKGVDKDCTIFERFLETLEPDQLRVFFARFYLSSLGHLTHKPELRQSIIYSKVLLSSWETAITNSARDCNEEQMPISETWPSILLKLCDGCIQEHRDHLATVIRFIDIAIISTLAIDNHLSSNSIDWLLHLIRLCLSADCFDEDDGHSGNMTGVVPISLLKSMLQLVLCSASSDGDAPSLAILSKEIESITDYLLRCPPERASFLVLELIGETVSSEQHHVTVVPEVVKVLVQAVLGSARSQVITTLESGLVADLDSLETILASQLGYRFPEQILCVLPIGGRRHCLLVRAVRCVYAFSMLQLPNNEASVDCAVLVHAAIRRAFSSCHYSSQLLEECERLHKFLTTVLGERNSMIDRLMLSLTTTDQSDGTFSTGQSAIFKRCPLLAMCALDQMLSTGPGNYSQWSEVVSNAIDWAMISCTDLDNWPLYGQNLSLVTRVLLPCAIRARYLVQEQMLAAVSAFLAVPDLARVNRAISIATGLCVGDPSFFPLLMPLVLAVKPVFLAHLDTGLDLVALLQFLVIGLESSRNRSGELDQAQWEFVLCMIETLIRAPHLSEPFEWHRDEDAVDTDVNKTLYWLLRLIATTTLSMAAFENRQSVIVDEWTDLFSGPIYTTVLDRFSEAAALAGPPTHIGLVFYLEVLADAVSLCPSTALLQHGFTGASVGLQDPLDLPTEFLLAFNWLLDSMSSEALPVQLASYHCLVELAGGRLVELLLTQMDAPPRNVDATDITVSIQLPERLVDLLETFTIDGTDPVRGLLAWNLVLHLVTGAPPKLRAEICSFLTGPERCFDRFLGSCFAFMPKNPLVNKRNLLFMETVGSNASSITCNLIVDEPDLFTRCHSNRSQFTVYHLAAHTFRRSLQVLPNLCRQWWRALDSPSQQLVDTFVRQFVTRELFRVEFEQLQRSVGLEFDDDRITIKTLPVIGEVIVTYHVSGDQTVEQLIRMPGNYPIGSICTEYKKEMTTAKIRHWKHWITQMSLTFENQNGSIFDGIRLWKRNLDNYFAGIEECMICYSIIHPSKFNLPSMPCYQCKKKFHKECMYKWFHSSANPTCPNCRNVFYDGSQKIGVR